MTPTTYIPIPASQPPPKQGYYHVIGAGEYYAFYHGGGLYPQNNGWDLPVTHWLKSVVTTSQLIEKYLLTLENK